MVFRGSGFVIKHDFAFDIFFRLHHNGITFILCTILVYLVSYMYKATVGKRASYLLNLYIVVNFC